MQKIDDLQLEIKSFESEIANLQAELAAAGGVSLRLASGESANNISLSIRAEAIRLIETQPVIRGLRDAIAELTSHLNQKQIQVQELEKQQQQQDRLKRVEQAKQKLRQHIEKVDNIASLLQSEFLLLKAIYQESNADFKALGSAEPGSYAYGMNQLIHFEFLRLPVLHEKDGSFILSSRVFDLFGPEQKAKQEEQAARSRVYRENHERETAEIKQRELEEKLRTEREYRASLLVTKQQELKDFKSARTDRLASLKTADVGGFDSAIASLEAEITALEAA
jgi:DNA-binding protein H-NS